MRSFLLLFSLACITAGQTAPAPAPLTDAQAEKACERALQLIEAGGVTMPETGRAGLPLLENMRQILESIKFNGLRVPHLHYQFQSNLRAWIFLSDAVPKPALFPEQARKQLVELRDIQVSLDAYLVHLMQSLHQSLRDPDRDNLRRYASDNATLPAPNPQNPRVVLLGDSITDAWRLNEYFPGRDFVNRGISGQITSQMLARFLPDVAALRPAAVVLLAGTNDIARGVDMEVIKKNVTAICDLADHYKIRVLLATLLPVSDYHMSRNPAFERTRQRPPATLQTFNTWLQTFAAQRKYILVDYYKPLLDARGQLAAELADDGLHPNSQGYRLMAPVLLTAVDQAFPKAQPSGRRKRLFE
jgi:lysophospholipase L1-like esterase